MTVIGGSPESLRTSARLLSSRSGDLQSAAQAVRQHTEQAISSWQGTAALRFAAQSRQAAGALASTGERLDQLATATNVYAGQLDSSQQRVRTLSGQRDEARTELAKARLRASAALTAGSSGSVGRDCGVADAERRVRVLGGQVEQVAAEQLAQARGLATALRSLDPRPLVPDWMHDAIVDGTVVAKTTKAVTKAWLFVSFTRHVRLARQALRLGDLATYQSRVQAAAQAVELVMWGKPGRWTRVLPGPVERTVRLGGRFFLPGTVAVGVHDAVTGGGYQGWRAGVTRVLGGTAALGAGTLLLGAAGLPLVTLAAPAALAVLTAYTAWTAGNFAWDHRAQIARFGRQVWRGGVAMWRAQQRIEGRAAMALAKTTVRVRQATKAGITRARRAAQRVQGRVTPVLARAQDALRKKVGPIRVPIQLPLIPVRIPLPFGW